LSSSAQQLANPLSNGRFVRTSDLYAKSIEWQLSAIHVEMCMVQYFSLWGFLAFIAIGTNVRTSLIPLPAPKNQSPYPRLATRKGKPDGVWVYACFMSEAT
jgi:hypothetical protein